MCAAITSRQFGLQQWGVDTQHGGLVREEAGLRGEPPCPAAASQGIQQALTVALQHGQEQQDMEGIRGAFSPVNVLGIRSLPDALHPGYRMELLMQLKATEKQRSQSIGQAHGSGHHYSRDAQKSDSMSNSTQLARGSAGVAASGKLPQRYGPCEGYFSCYQHLTSEYERRDIIDKFERLHGKLAQVGLDDFVVRGCPPPCQHSTTFANYAHDLPPLQEVDHLGRPRHEQQPRQQRVRPFIPAGRNSSPDVLLKGQAADMLAGLDAALSKDWPHSFIKAFMDHEGSFVLSFDRAAAAAEGDLTSYLNHQEKHGSTMVEFRLVKDPNRWGILDDDGASVFYVLTPPWCKNRAGLQRQP